MRAYRDAKQVIQCDGCFRVLASRVQPEGDLDPTGGWTLADRVLATHVVIIPGPFGDRHVCSRKCHEKVETNPPQDLRNAPEELRVERTLEATDPGHAA